MANDKCGVVIFHVVESKEVSENIIGNNEGGVTGEEAKPILQTSGWFGDGLQN